VEAAPAPLLALDARVFGRWVVDLEALRSSAPVAALGEEERARAVALAQLISLEVSAEQLKARFDQEVTTGSYSVVALLGRSFTLNTQMGPKAVAAQIRLELGEQDSLVLHTDTGALPLKRVTAD